MLHALTLYLLDPVVLVLVAIVVALAAGRYGHVLQRRVLAGIAAVLFCLVVLPVDEWLARPLENEYPRPALPSRVDGIVILDGGLQWLVFATRDVQGHNPSVFRILAGADLAKRFPAATLVYSGTPGNHNPHVQAAARATVDDLISTAGVAPGRIRFEQASRDTAENLVNSMKLVRPKPGETWMLVTSAVHMPRAMAIARKLGWTMVPWPSDYISDAGGIFHFGLASTDLANLGLAIHEWIGIAYYRLTGRA